MTQRVPKIRINEIFYTIQGEGINTGVPAVFIRTSGCNLRCQWCDTKYASWDPEGDFMTVADIAVQVLHATDHAEKPIVVITGGEPMIVKAMPVLVEHLQRLGYRVTIETAGTVYNTDCKPDLYSISPKLGNSYPAPGTTAYKIHNRANHFKRDLLKHMHQLKFVVDCEENVLEVIRWMGQHGIERSNTVTMLMPTGETKEQQEAAQVRVAELAIKYGFRYCPRVHVNLWSNTKGK